MATQMVGLVPSQLLQSTSIPASIPITTSDSKVSLKKKSRKEKNHKQKEEFTPTNNKGEDKASNESSNNEQKKKRRPRRRRRKKVNKNEQETEVNDNKNHQQTSDVSSSNKLVRFVNDLTFLHDEYFHRNNLQSYFISQSKDDKTINSKNMELIDTTKASTKSLKDEQQKRNRRRRNRNRKGTKESKPSESESLNANDNESFAQPKNEGNALESTEDNMTTSTASKTKNSRNKNRRKKSNKKKFPWRVYIPDGAVDPISLDPLKSLPYPPFALVIEPPYEPIKSFPPTDIIQQTSSGSKSAVNAVNHLHLYDGRVLAYYLISQLQFIDPLNRRDLTRLELDALDQYLSRNKLGNAHVVKAYDYKGVTISTAGSEAQTASGQARILQEEATSILNSLFAGTYDQNRQSQNTSLNNAGVQVANDEFRNDFERQYMEHERKLNQRSSANQRENASDRNANNAQSVNHINGGAHIEGSTDDGMIVIDDDEFPGLRGGFYSSQNRSSTTYVTRQASNINPIIRENRFPALQSTQPIADASSQSKNKIDKMKEKGPSRSLKFISKTITKTDPNELLKQRKAREEMQRRAALSRMSLLTPPSNNYMQPQIPMSITTPNLVLPPQSNSFLDAQIKRNRILAQALNVAPATARINFNTGWARPIEPKIEHDEFGNELNATIYPESLIIAAKDRMGEILRVEKRWIAFLTDDKASFLNLRPMLKDLRKLIHEYSDFWNLHTESFDKEPKRYINCKKLRDTCAPHPLLSIAVKNYRPGNCIKPIEKVALTGIETVHAEPTTLAPREFSCDAERKPLPLLPRSVMTGPPDGTMYDYPANSSATTTTKSDDILSSTRFASLSRERTKLTLEPRTIPLELPSFNSNTEENGKPSLTLKEKQKLQIEKRKERNEKEEAIIAAAFASDDEDHETKDSDSSSEWSDKEPMYHSSDDDED